MDNFLKKLKSPYLISASILVKGFDQEVAGVKFQLLYQNHMKFLKNHLDVLQLNLLYNYFPRSHTIHNMLIHN